MDIRELETCKACIRWLGKYVEKESDEPKTTGLFRVRAADSTTALLKQAINKEDDELPYDKLKDFVYENEPKLGTNECANAIGSLLKGYLHDFPQPLLPFNFGTKDLKEFDLDKLVDDVQRSEVGATLAQDLISVIVSVHGETCDNQVLESLIILAGQLFSLLCSVSRCDEINMSAYDLFVPFLPTICGARDPTLLMKEHGVIKELNNSKREAEANGTRRPKTRLEIMILYGHRIWGYVKECIPSLNSAVIALRELSEVSSRHEEHDDSHNHRRKRDVLKRVFLPNRWFKGHNNSQRKMSETGENSELVEPLKVKPPSMMAPAPSVTNYSYEDTSAFHNDARLKDMAPGRVSSVRLASAESETQSVKSTMSREELAAVGKSIFRTATAESEASADSGVL
mmetsp:Transcript_10477/g.17067  ORF Transcript_10477/g.17067 Transcript_10477/m.17067 type:complete len:399 (-) Transcript_10477:1486-2682(-)